MGGRKILNAVIVCSDIWLEEQDKITSMIDVEFANKSLQGFGGYDFRFCKKHLYHWIKRVMEVVGVDKWDKLKGEHIRIDQSWDKIHGIGNIIKDEWFYPEEEFKKL